jgi:endoribonuclease Dicer
MVSSSFKCITRPLTLSQAIIDMIVTEHLFLRYPQATSGQLTWMRSRAVCAASLSLIAVRELHLHKYLLYNNPDLGKEMAYHVQILDNCSYSDMTERGWKYDPPKVISDLTESVFGAIFIDCGYNYDLTKAIILRIFGDLLAVVTPDLPKDPSAELLMWVTRHGCRQSRFRQVLG